MGGYIVNTEELLLETSKLYLGTSAALQTALEQNAKLNDQLLVERKKNDELRTEIELLTVDLDELRRTNEEGTIRRY